MTSEVRTNASQAGNARQAGNASQAGNARSATRNVCVTGLPLVAVGLAIISRIGTDTPYCLMLAGLIHAGGPIGAHARTAFADGIHAGLLYAAGAAILAAIAVATLLTRGAKIRRPAALRCAAPTM